MKLIIGSFDWLLNYLKLILVDKVVNINHFLFLEEKKIYVFIHILMETL